MAWVLLATELGSEEELREARRLFDAGSACAPAREGLNVRVGDMRGAVAEAMLEADSAALARLSARPAAPAVRAAAGLDGRAFVAAYAACLAEAEPAKSVALLATPHGGLAEVDAFASYDDRLNDCMPEGVSYRIDRFDVRNHIAAHLYKLATAGEGR
ncbi:hypothetical protein [Sphingosinicella sp.]|uniref:hypothetical protein n=1 Tax=Sphingosinicella sp. TaxID=1917971 RepID=UPI0040378A20